MVSGLGQIRALQTIRREMDSWTICVNGEIGKGVTVALERGQTMPGCRRRKSQCSTWDKHNFILMNNWESLELGWDVSVSRLYLDRFQQRSRIEQGVFCGIKWIDHIGSWKDTGTGKYLQCFPQEWKSRITFQTFVISQKPSNFAFISIPLDSHKQYLPYISTQRSSDLIGCNLHSLILPYMYLRLISMNLLCGCLLTCAWVTRPELVCYMRGEGGERRGWST